MSSVSQPDPHRRVEWLFAALGSRQGAILTANSPTVSFRPSTEHEHAVTTATSAELSTLAGPYLAVMRRENSNVTSGATTKLDVA